MVVDIKSLCTGKPLLLVNWLLLTRGTSRRSGVSWCLTKGISFSLVDGRSSSRSKGEGLSFLFKKRMRDRQQGAIFGSDSINSLQFLAAQDGFAMANLKGI